MLYKENIKKRLNKVEKEAFHSYIERVNFINSHGEFTMKKLLTMSVLAATLVSTAVFAQEDQQGGNANGFGAPGSKAQLAQKIKANKDANGPTVLALSQRADREMGQGFGITQAVIEQLAGGDNHAKAIKIALDPNGRFQGADLQLAKAITAAQQNTVAEAVAAYARLASNKLPGAISVTPGNDASTIVQVNVLEQVAGGRGHTFALAVAKGGSNLTFKEVKADQAAIAKLQEQRGRDLKKAVAADLSN